MGRFLLRLVAAAVVVFCTFNPTGHSYVHWVAPTFPHIEPLQAVAGVALLIGWILHLRATVLSLGGLGVLLAAGFLAAVLWLLVSWEWIRMDRSETIAWVVLSMIAILLALGVSWSSVRRRITGQVDVRDADTP
jgi:hypothetical protein